MSTLPSMSHRERMEACLSGQKVDRPPVSLWRHFPVDDQTPDGLAAAVINFQKTYDFDFIKVTPASSYCLKDWGAKDQWEGSSEGTREYQNAVIQRFDDWRQLEHLDPTKGELANMLSSLRQIIAEFSPQVPVIQTIFSPLAQAKNLIGRDRLAYHIRTCPEAVHIGLEDHHRNHSCFYQ